MGDGSEVGVGKVGAPEAGSAKVREREVGAAKENILEIPAPDGRPAQVGLHELGTPQLRRGEDPAGCSRPFAPSAVVAVGEKVFLVAFSPAPCDAAR